MKVVAFSNSNFFVKVCKLACTELDWNLTTICERSALDIILKNYSINLLIIDCDTFRPSSYNILEDVQNINKKTYCLVVETSLHEIDKDALMAQISKQCMLQEIYYFQQFVKVFCNNYWNESERKILQNQQKINYDDFISFNENKISFIGEKYEEKFNTGLSFGFGEENISKLTEQINYENLEPTAIKILEYLKENKNTPVSIKTICNYVWGECNILKRNAIYFAFLLFVFGFKYLSYFS